MLSSQASSDSLCTYGVPKNVFVSNLHNGYNSSSTGSGYTGYINFDLYIEGVVQGEIGSITTNLETKKAQAVAARSFSTNRHERELAVNLGQAYHDSPNESSSLGSQHTSGIVVLYNNSVIDAKYSARCNGDYTQNAYEGTWSPYTTCETYGNDIQYLKSVPCSGHTSCSLIGETPCCNATISTTGNSGYIFGHGVGMCQRGIEQFGEQYGWNYCDMLHHYYTDICIANTDCQNIPQLDCSNAIELTCGEIFEGAVSNDTSNLYNYGCNQWTESGPERVHKYTALFDGTLTASISDFTGDLDVFILGSCNPFDCLGTVSSFESIAEVKKDSTYYIVVDSDDGSNSSYKLTLSCSPAQIKELNVEQLNIYPNPTSGLLFFNNLSLNHTINIYNSQGQLMTFKKTPNSIDISHFPIGLYFIRVTNEQTTFHHSILKQ